MSGIAGENIGLGDLTNQPPIAGTVALTQAGTSGRGCMTNFIGFGLDATSAVPNVVEDFNVTDDSVEICATGSATYEPDYTTSPDNLVWTEVVVP